MGQSQAPIVHRVLTKLARAEIAGVNAHTLPVALHRAERDHVPFDTLTERQAASAILERSGYPETVDELTIFLRASQALTASTLTVDEISEGHAPAYMRWVAAFIDDPDANTQRNARTMLRWLVANRAAAIHADQPSLNNIRRFADDPDTSPKSSAYIVYSLGVCGNPEDDYERVIRHAEKVIEQDRERLDMVAEALYRMYPPALINAVQFFLDSTAKENSGQGGQSRKQFATGMYLLEKVADIEDPAFWRQYYDDMDTIVSRLAVFAKDNPAVERTVDQIEKHLALAFADEDE
jgi:hypothetical protein